MLSHSRRDPSLRHSDDFISMHWRATCSNVELVSAAMRASTTSCPAMLERIDLLLLQLAPQLERLLARLRQRDELKAPRPIQRSRFRCS